MNKGWVALSGLLLAACGAGTESSSTAAAAKEGATGVQAIKIEAPAGRYQVDPNHASLRFSVKHVGLAEYHLAFTDYDMSLVVSPDKLEHSSVSLVIRPQSITATYSGDYQATHKQSPYSTWEEALARSPKFLNADEHDSIVYESTQVTALSDGRLQIDGQLTLLGETHPVRLYASLSGAYAEHPFTGRGALGFSAIGEFQRSVFGLTHLLEPSIISDRVTVRFDGEFHQAAPTES